MSDHFVKFVAPGTDVAPMGADAKPLRTVLNSADRSRAVSMRAEELRREQGKGKKRLLAFALFSLSLLAAYSCAGPDPAPSVILVSVDALRPDHLGSGGYHRDTSPQLDRFARSGARFSCAVCQATWTLPSVTSLFLSQYVSTHGVEHPSTRISEEAETLAEVMRANSYRTAAILMGGYTSADFGMDQGFEFFSVGDGYAPAKFARLIEWIDSGEGPFFAYVHLPDVHHPYTIENPYRDSYGAGFVGTVTGSSKLGRAHAATHTAADLQHLRDLYDDEISAVDHHFGNLLGALRERQLLGGTIVVVTADHGEAFGEHGALGHRGHPFDEQSRIPLLFAGPGVPEGRVIGTVVEAVDIAPTILDLTGIERGAAMQGRSLAPLWTTPSSSGGAAFTESILLHYAAIRTDRWALILDTESRTRVLYDLASDPGQKTDVSARHPDKVEELSSRLDAFFTANLEAPRNPPSPTEVEPETNDQLRALGYLE